MHDRLQISGGNWSENIDATAETAEGRIEVGLSLGSVSSTATAAGIAGAILADASSPDFTITGETSALTGAVPYVDYGLGDTITVPGHRGVATMPARVLAITVDASGEKVRAWPELVYDPTAE